MYSNHHVNIVFCSNMVCIHFVEYLILVYARVKTREKYLIVGLKILIVFAYHYFYQDNQTCVNATNPSIFLLSKNQGPIIFLLPLWLKIDASSLVTLLSVSGNIGFHIQFSTHKFNSIFRNLSTTGHFTTISSRKSLIFVVLVVCKIYPI